MSSEDQEGGKGGRQAGRRPVVDRGDAGYTQGRESPAVPAVGGNGQKAGFTHEDGGGLQVEAVGDPPARSVPEGVHCCQGVVVGGQEVRSVRKDRKRKALRDAVVEEGSGPCAGGREPFDEREAGLSQGDPVGEMVLSVECRGEPVAKLPDYLSRAENETVQGDGRLAGGGALARGPPVDEFCFRSREFDLQPVSPFR